MQHTSGNSQSPRLAVLVSGHARGSNLQSLIDAYNAGILATSVVLVIGTNSDCKALERAQAAGIETIVISPNKPGRTDEGYGECISKALIRRNVDIVCLLGYMRRLPTHVVTNFKYRILNIHPSLLPLFGGQGMYGHNVHAAVIESGVKVTGVTVHLVDEDYDTGPILIQRVVDVLDEDTPETLAARVLECEHRAIVDAVRLVAETGIKIVGRRVVKSSTLISQEQSN